jgi:hypothetical protein
MKSARISVQMLAGIALGAVAPGLGASPDPAQLVTPLSSSSDAHLPAPWQIVTLPKISRHTQYELVTIDGRRAVKATAEASYANVVHRLNADVTATPRLQFSWRVDRFPAQSDLAVKAGDDLAAKVCVLFDLPLSQLGFFDRLKIQLGRRLFKLDLPAATVCYVWDRTLPPGTWLPNAYTDRVHAGAALCSSRRSGSVVRRAARSARGFPAGVRCRGTRHTAASASRSVRDRRGQHR